MKTRIFKQGSDWVIEGGSPVVRQHFISWAAALDYLPHFINLYGEPIATPVTVNVALGANYPSAEAITDMLAEIRRAYGKPRHV